MRQICCFKFRKCLLFEYIWHKMSRAILPIFKRIKNPIFIWIIWKICIKFVNFLCIYEYQKLSLFVKPLETPWKVRINIFNISFKPFSYCSPLERADFAFSLSAAPRDPPLGEVTENKWRIPIWNCARGRELMKTSHFVGNRVVCWEPLGSEKDAKNVWGQFVQKQSAQPRDISKLRVLK